MDRQAGKDKEDASRRRRYHEDHPRRLVKQRTYQANNREKYRAASKRWRQKNPAKQKAATKEWLASNLDKNAAAAGRYYARKQSRMPRWLTAVQHDQIALFYVVAAAFTEATGVPHSVDHIVPLFGETVCGLHVPWNLQVITAEENSRKGIRLDYEAPYVFRLPPI